MNLISTEATDYRTATDRDFPDFAKKARKLAPLVDPPLSPTEVDQFVERWGAFLIANEIVQERHALELFNGILQARTKADPDTMNLDPPRLYCRTRDIGKVANWVDAAKKSWDGTVGE